MVCTNIEIVDEINKIIFNFSSRGKDKMKRSALISDVEYEGSRAPHLKSINY